MENAEIAKCIENDCGLPIEIAFAVQRKKQVAFQAGIRFENELKQNTEK